MRAIQGSIIGFLVRALTVLLSPNHIPPPLGEASRTVYPVALVQLRRLVNVGWQVLVPLRLPGATDLAHLLSVSV